MKGVAAIALGMASLALPAQAAAKSVLVLNGGAEAIFTLRAGPAGSAARGGDLLGLAEAIDVSQGREISIDVDPAACTYDFVATYGDGHTQTQTADLCKVDRVRFDH